MTYQLLQLHWLAVNALAKARISTRWSFLEQEPDPCATVSRRMEVLYLNAAARLIIPADWFGRRCWQAFPVQDDRCASQCQAVWAVSHSKETEYCEETIYPAKGTPILVGVAVIPLEETQSDGEQAILLLRPKPADSDAEAFKRLLLDDATRLRSLALAQFKGRTD